MGKMSKERREFRKLFAEVVRDFNERERTRDFVIYNRIPELQQFVSDTRVRNDMMMLKAHEAQARLEAYITAMRERMRALLKPLPLPWWDLRTASGDLPAVDLDATVRFADQTNHRRALVQYWRHLHELEKDRAKKPN